MREERSRLCTEAEALGQAVEPAQLRAALDALQARWAALIDSDEVEAPADGAGERFDTACRLAWHRLAELEAARAVEMERATARAQALQSYADLCALVDTLDGADALQRLEQAQQMWADLPAFAEDEDDAEPQAITAPRQFAAAVDACRARFAARQAAQGARTEFERLLVEAGAAVDLPDVREGAHEARDRRARVERAGECRSARRRVTRAVRRRARERIRARDRAARTEREHEQQRNAARIATLCDRLETMARSDRLTLREADLGLREARSTLGAIGTLPRHERDRLTARVRSVHAILASRVRELRELKDWQKWANVGVQEELCAEVEALESFNDLPQLARRLRGLLDRWKQVSVAQKREETDALWRRFTAAYDKAHARCEEYVAAQTALQVENLKLKEALCAQAEALAESTDWVPDRPSSSSVCRRSGRRSARCRATGPRSHGSVFVRPAIASIHAARPTLPSVRPIGRRTSSGRMHSARKRKRSWNRPTGSGVVAEIRKLQAEWRTVGAVKKNRSEAIWKRFPWCVRSVLRAVQPARPPRAGGQGCRARDDSQRSRGARAGGRGCSREA